MSLYDHPDFDGHEHVNFFCDEETGLKAIVAIHNTALGIALGGCRMRPYRDENEALKDVLRLSSGMTRKSAVANLPFGGGKTVVWGDPATMKTPALLRALGRALKTLEDRYMTGEDMGMELEDFLIVRQEAGNIIAADETGRLKTSGTITALGLMGSIEAALEASGMGGVDGKRIAVQGLGHVGLYLCELLTERGAELFVTDVNKERVEQAAGKFGATAVSPDEITGLDVDIFSPCAMGGVINPESVAELRCKMINGAANNQLSDSQLADRLHERGIVYVPDYVANAGGLVRAGYEALARMQRRDYGERDEREVLAYLHNIPDTVKKIIAMSQRDGTSPLKAAEDLALDRVRDADRRRRAKWDGTSIPSPTVN